MKDYEAKAACTKTCWTVAALVGGMVGVGLWLLAEYTITQAIFMAVIAFLVLGLLLTVFLCRSAAPKMGMHDEGGAGGSASVKSSGKAQGRGETGRGGGQARDVERCARRRPR